MCKVWKKTLFSLLIIAAVIVTSLCYASPVFAASTGVNKITYNKEYKSWDIDGDGKKDTFEIRVTPGAFESLYSEYEAKVYVNNKCKYTIPENGELMILYMVSLETGDNLLFVRLSGDSEDGPSRLIAWSKEKNKLVTIFNVSNAAGIADYGYHLYIKPISVSEDKVKFSFFNYNYVVGDLEFSYEYRYSEGRMKRASNWGSIIKMHRWSGSRCETTTSLIAARKINIYKKPGSGASANLQQTIKKGKRVKFTGTWTNGKQFWMRVTVNGKRGYIKCYKEGNPKSELSYFRDAFFAG